MSTRHQTKAGRSLLPRHRDIRRCLSDGPERKDDKKRERTVTEVDLESHLVMEWQVVVPEGSDEATAEEDEIEDDVIVDVCDVGDEEDSEDEETQRGDEEES